MNRFITKIKGRSIPSLYRSLVAKVWDIYYDFKYNIETNTHVQLDNLDLSVEEKKHYYWYEGTKGLPLKKLFHRLDIAKDSVFVDIGSGKGRVLFIAADYGFKTIRGVELSSDLCAIAKENLIRFRRKSGSKAKIEIINKDALNYNLTNEDVIFLYNPFDEHTLKRLVLKIKDVMTGRNKKLKIIYANDVHRQVIEENMNLVNVSRMSFYNVGFSIYDVQ